MFPMRTSTRYERLLTENHSPSSYNSVETGLLHFRYIHKSKCNQNDMD